MSDVNSDWGNDDVDDGGAADYAADFAADDGGGWWLVVMVAVMIISGGRLGLGVVVGLGVVMRMQGAACMRMMHAGGMRACA